jgi:hypothetical protein
LENTDNPQTNESLKTRHFPGDSARFAGVLTLMLLDDFRPTTEKHAVNTAYQNLSETHKAVFTQTLRVS